MPGDAKDLVEGVELIIDETKVDFWIPICES